MQWIPKKYQGKVVERMVAQRHLGVFLDPGLGKSSPMLTGFDQLRDLFDAHRMLVIAPVAVCYNVWPREVAKWDHTSHLKTQILHDKTKTAEALASDAEIFLINPEGLVWLAQQKWDLPDTLVIDESTKFKHVNGRFRALRKLLKRFDRRYILTGTPTPNGLLDLFGQIFCLDLGEALGTSIKKFKQEYFIPIRRGKYWDWEARPDAAERIYKKLGPLILRLEGDDLDLPDLVINDIPVQLPAKARKLYKKLRDELVVTMQQGEIVALNAGSLTSKCRQVAGGRIYLSDFPGGPARKPDGRVEGRDFAVIHEAKTEAVQRIVAELGGKPILFAYEFKHDLMAINKAVGCDVPLLKGTDTNLVDKWNRGEVPFMVAHPKSAGHGLNLQEGGHVLIWLSPPYDLELYDQMIRRLYRQGQTERVLVYRLIAEGTVDKSAARALQLKDADQSALLNALREDLHGEEMARY